MKKLIFLLIIIFSTNTFAELKITISQGLEKSIPIIVNCDHREKLCIEITDVIKSNLYGSGYFLIQDEKIINSNLDELTSQYALWTLYDTDYAVKSKIFKKNEKFVFDFKLYDVNLKKILFNYQISFNNKTNIRKLAHVSSNKIFEKITSIKGIFDTKIAYISSSKVNDKKIYKLFVSDIDGYNPVAIFTSKRELMSPTWSPDNKKLAYVSFENKRPEIFIQTLSTGERFKMNNKVGSSSAPAWSPDGKYIAYSQKINGNLEIFIYNLANNKSKRITKSIGIDTEPEWSNDGKFIFFTSDRSGRPQIYKKSINKTSKAKRITFEGIYNADSSSSSNGKYIAMVHNSGKGYNIGILNIPKGYLNIISNGKLDEAPSFAPNSAMILYAAKMKNKGVLYATSIDGRIKKRIELNSMDVREPVWSN